MIDHDGNNLGFVFSLPRSGSTLLSAILGGHENIHSPNEPWILLALSSLYDLDQAECRSSRSRHDNLQAIHALRDFIDWNQFSNASREFAVSAYNSALSSSGKKIFLDKTPRYFHVLPWIDKLFPNAKKIWLKRNPLDVAASHLTTWNIGCRELTGEPMSPASYDLTIGLHRLADYAEGSPNVLEIQYEEVAKDPTAVRDICRFMGVEYDQEMLNYSKGIQASGMKDRKMGDKKLYKYEKPHTDSLGRWPSILKLNEIQRLIDFIGHEIFERMGYPETILMLKKLGIRFPSKTEMMNRHHEIMNKDLAPPSYTIDDSIEIAKKYYKKTRQKKFPPWFFTRDGWVARNTRNRLIASKKLLARMQ